MPSNAATLHYFYDPLCGWCYGATPLIAAAAGIPGLAIELHGGGLMSGPGRCRVTPALRRYVMPHDRRIAELSGQVFGPGYFDGLLCDAEALFDSTPPIAAIRAVGHCGGQPLAMLTAIQQAHYVDGRRIAEEPTLRELAGAQGIADAAFAAAWNNEMQGPVGQHLLASQTLMREHDITGFPGLLLECDGRWQHLAPGPCLGQPEAWRRELLNRLAT